MVCISGLNSRDVQASSLIRIVPGASASRAARVDLPAAALPQIMCSVDFAGKLFGALAQAVERQPAGTRDIERQQAAGDGCVLEEMEHLGLVGKVGVEQQGGDHAEAGQRQASEAHAIANDHQYG